jgi:hypothetical protein
MDHRRYHSLVNTFPLLVFLRKQTFLNHSSYFYHIHFVVYNNKMKTLNFSPIFINKITIKTNKKLNGIRQ